MEGFIIEVKINKEIQRYQESILFGLSLRQMVFALLAIGVAVGAYFGLKPLIGAAEVGWVCMLAAFPFAMCGFFTYTCCTFAVRILDASAEGNRTSRAAPRKIFTAGPNDEPAVLLFLVFREIIHSPSGRLLSP